MSPCSIFPSSWWDFLWLLCPCEYRISSRNWPTPWIQVMEPTTETSEYDKQSVNLSWFGLQMLFRLTCIFVWMDGWTGGQMERFYGPPRDLHFHSTSISAWNDKQCWLFVVVVLVWRCGYSTCLHCRKSTYTYKVGERWREGTSMSQSRRTVVEQKPGGSAKRSDHQCRE